MSGCIDCGTSKAEKWFGAGVTQQHTYGPAWRCEGCYIVHTNPDTALCAEDVRDARLDCDAFGRVFDEIKLAVAIQVFKSIRDEQVAIPATARALVDETLKRIA